MIIEIFQEVDFDINAVAATLPAGNITKPITLECPQFNCLAKWSVHSNAWEISYPMKAVPVTLNINGEQLSAVGRSLVAVIYPLTN